MAAPKYSVLQIRPAKDSLTGQGAFVEFLSSLKTSLKAGFLDRLLGTYETICLEIVNLNQTTFFVVSCPERLEHLVRSQIAAQYPTALIAPMKDYLPDWLDHGQPSFGQIVLAAPSIFSINVTEDEKIDQMTSILGSLGRIVPGQAAVIQICLFAAPKNWQKAARGSLEIVTPATATEAAKSKPSPYKTIIEKKLAHQAFSTDIRIAAITPHHATSAQLLSQIAAAFGTYALSEGNSFKLKVPKAGSVRKLKEMILERSAKYSSQYQFLNYAEIAAIYHFPGFNLSAIKGISWGKTLKGEPPQGLYIDEGLTEEERQDINFFAKTEYKNKMVTFGMKKGDDRRRHIYILGKSGTGKSTLIANMAINDIQRGEGMALVDPHGDTAETLLDFIPEDRIADVAYLDPSIAGKSFHLNPLYVKNPAYGELVASGIVSIFSKLYGNSWGPRLEYILRNCLLTLVKRPGATLMDVPRLLTNKAFREDYLKDVGDPVLVNFWHDEYDKYSEKFQSEAISPILNKVGQFITSPTIRDVIGHAESTVDFEEMMNTGKIIILNLSQGRIGEDNAALLGAMFISQIQIAAMNRANMAEEKRKDFFLYVDEFQNFATTSFIKILSEARKYRLNLILANQYTAQLPIEIQDAIFGNAGTIISFVVGAADANRLMNELGNLYTQDDLVSLARYQVLIKMSVNATISTPFPAYTLPVPDTATGNKQKVLEATTKTFYRETKPMDMSQVTAFVTPPPAPNREQRREYSQPPRSEQPYRPAQPAASVAPAPRPVPPKNSYVIPPSSTTQPKATAPTPPKEELKDPSLEEMDELRKQGLRPSVVGCFLNDKKILLAYQKSFNQWTLPQGGVENKENIADAFFKELSEEVTEDFLKTCSRDIQLVAVDKIEFPPSKQGLRDMVTDSGQSVVMKGKYYYFYVTDAKDTNITIGATEFDDIKWLNFDEAYKLIKETNTGGRLRMTTNLLHILKDRGLLSTNQPNNNHGSQPQPGRENRRPDDRSRRFSNDNRRQQPDNSRRGGGKDQLHSTQSVGRGPDVIPGGDTTSRPAPDSSGTGIGPDHPRPVDHREPVNLMDRPRRDVTPGSDSATGGDASSDA